MPAKLFDKFWAYSEISGQLFLLVSGKKHRKSLLKLIEAGDTEEIEEWIAKAERDDMVKRLLRLGISERDSYYTPLFDEILMGTRSYEDGCGSIDYILSRRVGSKFHHRVYSDGAGVVHYRFETEKPMTKSEFRDLTTYPAPWEESGFEDQIAESTVWSIWDG